MENGVVLQLQRSKEGAAHPLAGNQCQPPQTYFVCQLSKPSPGKYSYESGVERAAKVVKFIKSVGRLVGWLDVTFPAEELEKMAKVDEYMLLQQLVSSDI